MKKEKIKTIFGRIVSSIMIAISIFVVIFLSLITLFVPEIISGIYIKADYDSLYLIEIASDSSWTSIDDGIYNMYLHNKIGIPFVSFEEINLYSSYSTYYINILGLISNLVVLLFFIFLIFIIKIRNKAFRWLIKVFGASIVLVHLVMLSLNVYFRYVIPFIIILLIIYCFVKKKKVFKK